MPTTESTLLSAATSMGAVTLRVRDLDAMTAYYQDAVTLTVQSQTAGTSVLGRAGRPLLILQQAPELRHAEPREAGLFHTAILFESDADLAAAVYSVASRHPDTFTGSADHLVSKAFYFTDPEGNGVELYVDRDRSEWSWTHGRLEMASLFLDPQRFLREHLDPDALQQAGRRPAVVGHVHLAVGDIPTARRFYVDQLGFATTAEYGASALFVSAGGYHHHMAMNTWNSAGAGRRRRTLGLGLVRIELPDGDEISELGERLRFHQVDTRQHDTGTLTFEDPWSNRIEVSPADLRTSV